MVLLPYKMFQTWYHGLGWTKCTMSSLAHNRKNSLGVYCLCETVANAAKNTTKSGKSSYLYLTFPVDGKERRSQQAGGAGCWVWGLWPWELGPRCPCRFTARCPPKQLPSSLLCGGGQEDIFQTLGTFLAHGPFPHSVQWWVQWVTV